MKGGRGVAQRVTVGGAGEARGVAEVEPDEYVNGEGGEEAAACNEPRPAGGKSRLWFGAVVLQDKRSTSA